LVWRYAPGRRRRPLFRVWGYAPTREAVSVRFHTEFHTHCRMCVKGRARKRSVATGGTVASACHDLHRKSNAEHLVAYITTHHESRLLALVCCRTGIKALVGLCSPAGASRQTGIFRVRYIPFMVGGRQGVWIGIPMGVCSGGRPPDRPHSPQSTVYLGVCMPQSRAFRSANHTLTPTYSECSWAFRFSFLPQ
jgi:hypothetical protein